MTNPTDPFPTTRWEMAKVLVRQPEFIAMGITFATIGVVSTLYLRKRRKKRRP